MDQRMSRKMMMAGVDRQELLRQKKRESRAYAMRKEDTPICDTLMSKTNGSRSGIILQQDNNLNSEPAANQPSTSAEQPQSAQRNFVSLPVLAKTLDRYGVSDRAGAAIASAVLKDFKIISKDDNHHVIDRYKIRRARDSERQKLQNEQNKAVVLQGLYFDGRKDKTLMFVDNRKRTTLEEHIVLLQEPDSKYLGHISPVSGSANNILKSMLNFFESSSISIDALEAIGCDGTNSNTGHKGGVITLLEHHLKRPLQWFICQLHANELPLRHLLQHLDGSTTGPRAFQGSIGKALNQCEKLPVVPFKIINSKFPEITSNDLGADQKYLFDICQVIITGTCSEGMSKRDPGKLNHSRWLTTANRILRLYTATTKPSEELIILTTFIIKVYAPMWFNIKLHSSCIYGAKHVFETIQLCGYLPEAQKSIVYPVIQRNGYFGHPENLLLCMLWDDCFNIRKLASLKILKARRGENIMYVRSFVIPKFNFAATKYYDIIDWQNITYQEPPVTKGLSEEQLLQVVADPHSSVLSYTKNYPSHTQAVERAVKLVTQVSNTVCDQNRRDGVIRSTLESRAAMPKFETKKDFDHK